jgi:hypothetical protein
MNPHLRVTMIQADLAWQEPAANRASFASHFHGLVGHTDLIVLPEMFTTGFSMAAETLAETMDGPTIVSSGPRRTAGSSTTTSATCSAWRWSRSITRAARSG